MKYWTRMFSETVGCAGCEVNARGECWAAQLECRMQHNPSINPDGPLPADKAIAVDGRWTGRLHVLNGNPEQQKRLTTRGRSHVIAVNWRGDLFSPLVPDEVVFDALNTLARNAARRADLGTPPHMLLFLTHWPTRMVLLVTRWVATVGSDVPQDPLWRSFWWGVSVTKQAQVLPASAVAQLPGHHWLSIEPLLEPVRLGPHGVEWVAAGLNTLSSENLGQRREDLLRLEDDCHRQHIPVWTKQAGPRHRPDVDYLLPREMPPSIARAFEGR